MHYLLSLSFYIEFLSKIQDMPFFQFYPAAIMQEPYRYGGEMRLGKKELNILVFTSQSFRESGSLGGGLNKCFLFLCSSYSPLDEKENTGQRLGISIPTGLLGSGKNPRS